MDMQEKNDEVDLDFSSREVPEHARMSKGALTMAWWALCSAMFWIVVSATLAINFGTKNALLGLGLSVVVYAVINQIFTRYAISTGLSVALFSRVLFGNFGAALATLIFFVTAIYYALFEGSVISVAIHTYYSAISLKTSYLIVVSYSVLLVFGSVQHWLDKLNGVLLPFYLLGLAAAVVMTVSQFGYSHAWLELGPKGGASAYGWWDCFTYFMGVWILMMYTWDYARFGKKKDARYHARINFGWPFYIFTFLVNGAIGIFLAGTLSADGAISEVSVVLDLLKLMGFGGLLFVWVSQTRINTANFYLAAANMHVFFRSVMNLNLPKFFWAIIVGVIVYFLMLQDVFSFILQALAYQGIFVVGWVAIALTHILSSRYSDMFGEEIEYRSDRVVAFNPCGLIAWFVSAASGIVLLEIGGVAGSFSALVAAISAALIYKVLLSYASAHWFVRKAAC